MKSNDNCNPRSGWTNGGKEIDEQHGDLHVALHYSNEDPDDTRKTTKPQAIK